MTSNIEYVPKSFKDDTIVLYYTPTYNGLWSCSASEDDEGRRNTTGGVQSALGGPCLCSVAGDIVRSTNVAADADAADAANVGEVDSGLPPYSGCGKDGEVDSSTPTIDVVDGAASLCLAFAGGGGVRPTDTVSVTTAAGVACLSGSFDRC